MMVVVRVPKNTTYPIGFSNIQRGIATFLFWI